MNEELTRKLPESLPAEKRNTRIARLFRLTLGGKLLCGFAACGVLTIVIAVVALSHLERLNEINNRIIKRDISLAGIADEMMDALLAQDLYGRRSLILKSPEMEPLFRKRSGEFETLQRKMRMADLSHSLNPSADRLAALHKEYNDLYETEFQKGKSPSDSPDRHPLIRAKQEEILNLLKEISHNARVDQNEKSVETLNIVHSAFWVTIGLTADGLLLGILIALVIRRNISRSVRQLKLIAGKISEGDFEHLPEVGSRDELGDLSHAFHKMARRLKYLEEMHLDANPLTRLPGNMAIENILRQRLNDKTPVAFCQLDLSHFKAFNDRYGYARGNEMLQALARIISEAVRVHGNEDCFVGHIGGDDFVLITSPETYQKLCQAIIDSFDRTVLDFYEPEDRKAGCIRGETRQGQKASFPIMSLAIAVVTNLDCELKNHVHVGEIAAEMKKYAKSFSRSTFTVNRRRDYASPRAGTGRFASPSL